MQLLIEEAEKSEEEHFKEELDRRVEPHSHKKILAIIYTFLIPKTFRKIIKKKYQV